MANISKLGKYLIRRELGKGAMGIVYEGFDPTIERIVAIKTILPQQLNAEEPVNVLARFKREAQAAGRLNHPNIVAIYDYGDVVAEDDSTLVAGDRALDRAETHVAYIAMEFVKGRELRDYFEASERFALKEVERIMGEILGALTHAHANGVVHRDMKPANLIVLDDGTIKVADFGIARIEKSELTQAGTVMGTPAYMSPEQFMGQTVDGRSDLFSCGVILYQFLTGEKPFTGNNTTIMYKVLREEPLAPSVLNVALPAAFDAVVKKAMAKSPDDRYQTAAEFATAIRAAVADKAQDNTVVTPRSQPARVADQNAVTAAQPVGQPPTQSRTLVVGGALFAVVTALLGGYVWNMRTKPVESVAIATNPPIKEASTVQVDTAVQEPGTLVISALGLVDPKDPKFNGDAGAAQTEVRADASRQLIEKALTLYMEKSSIDQNYALISQKILANSGAFIKTVIQEGAPSTGKDGLLETETRAVVKVREVQKALNQLSKDERINFIRNNGDPKVAIQMAIRNADTSQALPAERSMLAENVVKERIKSFGFRVWSSEGDIQAGPNVKAADFQILGEVRVKQLSARLEASGITINKTTMTSWTLKAIDKTSGEEIYLNTVTPTGKSWATEDQALGEIGKLVGDEFSKNFFLQHFNFGSQKVNLTIAGVPDAQTARLLLRELRGVQQILDAQLITDTGKYQLQLAEGGASDIVGDSVFKPLNVKMGQGCLLLAGSTGADISATFAAACAKPEVLGRLETVPPAGLINAPGSRSKPLLKASSVKML